jgi:hypothetical protein
MWGYFALLDPESDPATQINADPDPQFCLYGVLSITHFITGTIFELNAYPDQEFFRKTQKRRSH